MPNIALHPYKAERQQEDLQLGPGRGVPALVGLQRLIQCFKHKFPLSERKQKTSYVPRDIRGDQLAVPLSFFTQLAFIGTKPGGITRRAPGRTSRLAGPGSLSAGEAPSLSAGQAVTFPFFALIV